MRIRRNAARFLGSAYSAPSATSPMPLPPPPCLELCSGPLLGSGGTGNISSSATVSKDLCGLSRSPWDLIDDLPLSNLQVVDDFVDSYYVNLKNRKCWLYPKMIPTFMMKKKVTVAQLMGQKVIVVKKEKTLENATIKKKESIEDEANKKASVKKGKGEEEAPQVFICKKGEEEAPQVFICKKNDGRGWNCPKKVSCPNSLCEHHSRKKSSYSNPKSALATKEEKTMTLPSAITSKPSNNPKTRKKPTNHFSATEGFYYYAGFGPSRGKRPCRSTTHSFAPPASMHEEVEVDQPKEASPLSLAKVETADGVAAHDDVPRSGESDDIVVIDEESSGDDYKHGSSRRKNIKRKRNKNPFIRWRKPVKSRLLKSLL